MSESFRILNLRETFNKRWFERWTDLYERTFTDANTREPVEPWRDWYLAREVVWDASTGKAALPLTTLLAVSGGEGEPEILLGGLNIEFYNRSGCALATYMAVERGHRKSGIARSLLEAGHAYVTELAANLGSSLEAVLFETYRPHALESESVESQTARLAALCRLSGQRLVFEQPGYTQLALGAGQQPSSSLYLCYFEDYVEQGGIKADLLQAFLQEFAYALGGDEGAAALMGCPVVRDDGEFVASADLPSLESDHLKIERFAVSLHLLEESQVAAGSVGGVPKPGLLKAEESCDVFRTWEHDLMAHSYVDRRPFTSRCFDLGKLAYVEIEFPARLSYASEGRVVELFTRTGGPERRRFQLRASRTRFRESGRAVWHLTLHSVEGPPLHEFDFIKIISFYAGYEASESSLGGCVFRLLDQQGNVIEPEVVGFEAFVPAVFTRLEADRQLIDGSAPPILPRPVGGTIQILTPGGQLREDLQTVIRLAREARPGLENADVKSELEQTFATSPRLRAALLTTCGVVQGIFDFNEIDASELADILDPTMPELDAYYRIHRSTFVCICPEDRAFDASADDVGISPYLILPHAVLLHEGATMRLGSAALDKGLEMLSMSRDVGRKERQSALQKARQCLIEASRCLDSLPAPNPFNYFTERAFLERATLNHGLPARLTTECSRLKQLERLLEAIDDRSRRGREWALGLLLTVLTVISAGEFIDQGAHAALDWSRDGFAWDWDTGLTLIVSAALFACSFVALGLMLRNRPRRQADDA